MNALNWIFLLNLLLRPISVRADWWVHDLDKRRQFYVGLAKWSDEKTKIYCSGAILRINTVFVIVANYECLKSIKNRHDIKLVKWGKTTGRMLFGRVRYLEVRDKFILVTPKKGFIKTDQFIDYNDFNVPKCETVLMYILPYVITGMNILLTYVQKSNRCENKHDSKIPYDSDDSPNSLECYEGYSYACSLGEGYLVTCRDYKILIGIGLPMQDRTCLDAYWVRNVQVINMTGVTPYTSKGFAKITMPYICVIVAFSAGQSFQIVFRMKL